MKKQATDHSLHVQYGVASVSLRIVNVRADGTASLVTLETITKRIPLLLCLAILIRALSNSGESCYGVK